MSNHFATGVLMAALCLVLVGCGSDGPNLRPELDELTDLVGQQTEQLGQLQTDLETERQDAADREEALQEQIDKAEQETEQTQEQLEQTQEQLEQAQEQVQQAQQRAQEQIRQEAQKREATQRAQGLLTALEAVLNDAGDTWATPGNAANAGINTGQTDIELTASPLTGSTRKSGNFYTATLTRTAPGVGQPERKTIGYTDREKSRTFSNHYASFINDTVGGTTSNPRFVNSAWVGDLLSDAVAALVSNPGRGGHPATIAAGDSNPANRMVDRLSASVHGVSGHYGCYNSTTNAACKVDVAAAYAQPTGAEATDPQQLNGLTITPETGGTLYFDPGSGTISLLDVAKTGAPATTDAQYITFGWWQETPALADGTYGAAVFATPTGGIFAVADATGSAEYEGPAVGLYVDRTSEGGETIYESGDFTATAILRATFGSGADAGVEGDVTGFQTTHGTKNWHVRLTGDGDDADSLPDARIIQAGTSSTGVWEYSFLARHGNVATVDDQPIAAVGRFDVSIPNVRHIVGAFGAHRTTDPITQ